MGASVIDSRTVEGLRDKVALVTGGAGGLGSATCLDANRAMVKRARELAGDLDLAFLNAGVTTGCGIGDDFNLAKYRRAMGVNLDGVVFGTHAVLDALREQGRATSSSAPAIASSPRRTSPRWCADSSRAT